MSSEDGLEQLNYSLEFLQIEWSMLSPVEEIGYAERFLVEDRAAWLECAVFVNLKRASHVLERHLEGCMLLCCLCGRVKML